MALTDKLTAIANAIRAKTGDSGAMTMAQMPTKIAGLSTKEDISWHQCPEAVLDYIDNVTYNPSDYSTSEIADYAPAVAVSSNTKPIGKTVDSITYYNEVPNVAVPFASANKAGTIKPLDSLRWLNTTASGYTPYNEKGVRYPMGVNTRDLGGWDCDGGTVKYGMLIRGGEPNEADKDLLVNQVGIKSELYLLAPEEQTRDYSALGIDFYKSFTENDCIWYSLTRTELWRYYLRVVFDSVSHGKPVFFHCGIGADRTGTIAVMLEALLGMSQSDIDKEYELTNFYVVDNASPRRRNMAQYANYIAAIKAVPLVGGLTDTFRNHAISFAVSLGFTADEINAYRNACIDGTPEQISLSLGTKTIANTLSNVANSNSSVSVDEYGKYEAELTPASGYKLNDVSISMGGSDVKSVYYKEYNYPSNKGIISIPAVSGNVAITANACKELTNQISISIDENGDIYNGTGYKDDYRIRGVGSEQAYSGASVTGYIPAAKSDIFHISDGLLVPSSSDASNLNICTYKSDFSFIGSVSFNNLPTYSNFINKVTNANGDLVQFEISPNAASFGDLAYIRFTFVGSAENAIVTKNEAIE